jgi:DNA polymerase III epsilon subunit-like protein
MSIQPTSFMNMKVYQPDLSYRQRKLCFIDLEFTGLDLAKHEILSIAAVKVDQHSFEVLEEAEWKVAIKNPELIDPQARDLIKFDEQDWSTAHPIAEVLNAFNTFSDYATLVGYNIAFDWAFLHRDFEKNEIQPKVDYHMLDIMVLAYEYFKDVKNPKQLSLRASSCF